MDFLLGVFQNFVADLIFIVGGIAVVWLLAQRLRWRIFTAIFRLQRSGVSNIYLDRSEYISRRSVAITDYIESSTRSFEYVGIYFSLATDQSRIDDSIRSLIQKGCLVRIALLHAEAPNDVFVYLEKYFALAGNSLKPRVVHAREHFVALRASLAPQQRVQLDIRLHKLPLIDSAFVVDRSERVCKALVDRKWYGTGRDRSLGIEFTGAIETGGLFETVVNSFIRIIDESDQI